MERLCGYLDKTKTGQLYNNFQKKIDNRMVKFDEGLTEFMFQTYFYEGGILQLSPH